MRAGFTGTREGMTASQVTAFLTLVHQLPLTEFHHGDCVGADEEAHDLMPKFLVRTVGHPPSDPRLRAFCQCDELREPKAYAERDLDIVTETDCLIAAPKTADEQLRSGTWMTVRMARRQRKPIYLVNPDGSIVLEQP